MIDYSVLLDALKNGTVERHTSSISGMTSIWQDGKLLSGEDLSYDVSETITAEPVFVMFGAGHVGKALHSIASLCGIRTIILDDRPELATEERFPGAECHTASFPELLSKEYHPFPCYIIFTHGHSYDLECLRYALDHNAMYIGMIGSKRKVEAQFSILRQEGFSDEVLKHIHAPIGLSINAVTPEEIAVSIMAEIISEIRKDRKAVQINTELPVLRLQPEREIVDKENYVNTKVTLYSPFTDEGWYSPDDEPVEVRGRGNSTWILPKKPYRLKFPEKVSPIGLDHTKAKSWVILAHDMDKSLLRNHLAFEVSRVLFNPDENYHDPSAILFTPCSQFINVYMNDEYHGLYQMSDHMEQREGRIAVEELTDKDGADPEKITGGYIVETDIHEGNHYSPRKNIKMTYKYPDDKEYDPAQYEYITNFIGQMENALYSSSFKDPQSGWRKYLDEKTVIDFIIVKELCGDMDGYTSIYMYKRRGVDKLFFGPIWDVDKGWDNDNRTPHWNYPPESSLMMFAGFWMPNNVEYDWMQRLWDDETFRTAVAKRWSSVRDRLVNKIMTELDARTAAMSKAIEANYTVWDFNKQASTEANPPADTYPEEIQRIKDLTKTRAALLDRLFNE